MVLVDDADPVLIGNKVESVVPYLTNDEFSVVAPMGGKVIAKTGEYMVVQFDDGSYKTIILSETVEKNSSAGFYIVNQLQTELQKGDTFDKNMVIAFNPKAFRRDSNGKSVSMSLGPLVKAAIISNWDEYEDSQPVTQKLSDRLATVMVKDKGVALDKNTVVEYIAQPGQIVRAGETLIKFDQSSEDSDIGDKLIDTVRNALGEDIIESTMTTITTKVSGKIIDVEIISTVDTDDLSDSLKKIVEDYYDRITDINEVMERYSNPSDTNYYKSGNIVKRFPGKVTPDNQGRVRGYRVGEGVIIIFYVEYTDYVKKGDKLAATVALKAVCSHPIEKGLECYSEFRPDEEIDTTIAPLAVTARKTPTIFLDLFGNKVLIEGKRKLMEDYLKDE